MRNKREYILTIVLASAYVVLAFDAPIGLGITSNRIGFALLMIGFIVHGRVPRVIGVQRSLLILSLFILTLTVGCLSASFLFSRHGTLATVSPIVSILMIAAAFVAGFVLSHKLSSYGWNVFFNIVATANALLAGGLIAFIVSQTGVEGLLNQFAVRSNLDQVGSGLNRTMNGVVILNLFSCAIALGVIKRTWRIRVVAVIGLVGTLLLTVLSGSRQSLVAIIVMVLIYVFTGRTSKSSRLKVAASLIVPALMAFALVKYLQLDILIEQRFVPTFVEGDISGSDESRLRVVSNGLEYVYASPWLGLGPGVFPKLEGMYPHNGHLSLAVDGGILLLIAWWLVICIILYSIWTYDSRQGINYASVERLFPIVIFLIVFVMSIFNDLLRDYILCVTIAFGIARLNGSRQLGLGQG